MISAPAGDVDDFNRHYTAKVGGGCMSINVGTSFATPVISSIVAMMLEVNPNLGWRDVQGILIQSSRPVKDDPFDDTATTNGAGFWHSNLYGFGIADAAKAVEISRSWVNYGEEKLIAIDSGDINTPIYDDVSTETLSTITVQQDVNAANVQRQASDAFVVEAVEVLLDISHFSRGDLRITLTSPAGTESLMHPGSLPENGQLGSDQYWKLMTVRNWGESPYGEWALKLVDEKAGSFQDCADVGGFSFIYSDSTLVTCGLAERIDICKNGDYNADFFNSGNYDSLKVQTDDEGRTLKVACCVCGGGLDRNSAAQDELRHWTIAIFGRDDGEIRFETSPPSLSPTTGPPTKQPIGMMPTSTSSSSPTASPTMNPTSSPIVLPTASPTAAPTTVASLSASPSTQPSQSPTTMPSLEPSSFPSMFPSTSISPSEDSSMFSSLQPSDEAAYSSAAPAFPSLQPSDEAAYSSTAPAFPSLQPSGEAAYLSTAPAFLTLQPSDAPAYLSTAPTSSNSLAPSSSHPNSGLPSLAPTQPTFFQHQESESFSNASLASTRVGFLSLILLGMLIAMCTMTQIFG
jgi:subtilisin-like proprotein convertase family protein